MNNEKLRYKQLKEKNSMKTIRSTWKCMVTEDNNRIIKKYLDEYSFKNECDVYKQLEGNKYIPKLINIDENKLEITMEKIIGKNFLNYVEQGNKIPLNILTELEKIRNEFLKNDFYDYSDFFNVEHIFISETNDEGFCEIKVIDFGQVVRIKNEEKEKLKNNIKIEFNSLNTEIEKFQDYFSIQDNTVITDFFKNKLKTNKESGDKTIW